MTTDLVTDLAYFTPPVSPEDFGFDNLFSSNPQYDEAIGPRMEERDFAPVNEVGCFGVHYGADDISSEEDEEDYWERVLLQDPNEPLGPGETAESVREDNLPLIRVAPGYQPVCGPAQTSVRFFKETEVLPAKAETVKPSSRSSTRRPGDS